MLDDRPMMIMTILNDQFCFAQKRPKNAKMWKCKILDTFSMTFWLRTKFLGPAKIQNWTSGSVLEIPNSWLLVVEGAAELCRLILLISDHPIQQGYYKFWNQLFSGTPCTTATYGLNEFNLIGLFSPFYHSSLCSSQAWAPKTRRQISLRIQDKVLVSV